MIRKMVVEISVLVDMSALGQSLPKRHVRDRSGLPPIATGLQTSREVSLGPCVDGSRLARGIFTSQYWSEQPCVRPLIAVHRTAGHNAVYTENLIRV